MQRSKTVPTYEYRCEANGRLIEVRHNMAERLSTWGELCERAGISTGRTDPASPVEKLISAGFINSGAGPNAPACAAPDCGNGSCGTGACSFGD
jgi:predicted nucleic acid-binding Zn ribbon protein